MGSGFHCSGGASFVGTIHAHPAAANGPSNGVCRSLGFRFVGEREIDVHGAMMRCNHSVIDPRVDLV